MNGAYIRAGPVRSIAVFLLAAVSWLVGELLVSVWTIESVFLPELLSRFVGVLPWQLALFGCMGLAAALLSALRPISTPTLGWLAVGFPTTAFLGLRLAEGLNRVLPLPVAALGVLLLAIVVAVALLALARLGHLLPESFRPAWAAAVWVGWTLAFIVAFGRTGWEIGLWRLDVVAEIRPLELSEVATIAALSACAFAIRCRACRPAWRVAGLALLLAFGIGIFARAGSRPLVASGLEGRPDVLIILVDTLRFDHVGLHMDGVSITPTLDALESESIRFTRAFSPSNYTRPSMPGILASLPFDVVHYPVSEEVTMLSEHLQRAGWATFGASANPHVSGRLGYAQGFDEFVDTNSIGTFMVVHPLQILGAASPRLSYTAGIVDARYYYRTAGELLDRALEFMNRSPGPSFTYLQMMDAHGPYLPPKEFLPSDFDYGEIFSYFPFMRLSGRGILNSEEFRPKLENLRRRYAASVRYIDAELNEFFDSLKQSGRWDDTLVWVLSDHGEAFGEHDHAGHSGPGLDNTLIQIPVLLKPPRAWRLQPRTERAPISTYSLLPTTLSLLGLPVPDGLFGTDLSKLIRDGDADSTSGVIISQIKSTYSGVRWPWKLLVAEDENGAPTRRLFNLEEDPGEVVDVSARHPAIADELQREIDAWDERIRTTRLEASEFELDAKTQSQLRMLGYVE